MVMWLFALVVSFVVAALVVIDDASAGYEFVPSEVI